MPGRSALPMATGFGTRPRTTPTHARARTSGWRSPSATTASGSAWPPSSAATTWPADAGLRQRRRRGREHQDELRPAINGWTSTRPKAEAAALLQAAGVPAAPVSNGRDIAGDPGLHAAGFLVPLEHPEAGRHEYPGLAFGLGRTPGALRSAAPCFGQHNRFVLSELLGLDDAAIAELYAAGAVADQPESGAEVS